MSDPAGGPDAPDPAELAALRECVRAADLFPWLAVPLPFAHRRVAYQQARKRLILIQRANRRKIILALKSETT